MGGVRILGGRGLVAVGGHGGRGEVPVRVVVFGSGHKVVLVERVTEYTGGLGYSRISLLVIQVVVAVSLEIDVSRQAVNCSVLKFKTLAVFDWLEAAPLCIPLLHHGQGLPLFFDVLRLPVCHRILVESQVILMYSWLLAPIASRISHLVVSFFSAYRTGRVLHCDI